MMKKLLKYIKFIFCMMLIISLMIPSYAALSASDGSVFITKGEFNNSIADFNARLTTFEAGINSKIDSQVTSYLDKNGVWFGEVQELTGKTIKNGWVGSAATMTCYPRGFTSSTNQNCYRMVKDIDAEQCIVNSITKTGLACADIFITSSGKFSMYTNTRTRIVCGQSDTYPLNHDDWFTQVFIVKSTREGNKWKWIDTHRFINAMSLKLEPTVEIFAYFFVSAEDSLYISSELNQGRCTFGVWDSVSRNDYWYKTMSVNSLVVY